MRYKSIVTFIKDMAQDAHALETAAAIAEAEEGHLTAVCLGIDRIQPGAYYAGANAMALQQSLSEAQTEAQAAEKAARSALEGRPFHWEVAPITAQFGALGTVVSSRAQLADLVVQSKPYGPSRRTEDVAIVESALFGTRGPVLVLPESQAGALAADRIVVAWNESAEALAAIRAAMPVLVEADTVDIAIIDPPAHGEDRSDPGGLLAEALARHGVRADISVLAQTLPRVSDVLCRHVTDKSADLLVMGAYGHSRFREAILGGATRNMLEVAEVQVLMAH